VKIRVRLFGHFADYWDGEREVELAEGATAADAAANVSSSDERLATVSRICRAAVNEEYVPFAQALNENDLVVFIPPMSGG
jgi:molybdopterin converting factor small subunit